MDAETRKRWGSLCKLLGLLVAVLVVGYLLVTRERVGRTPRVTGTSLPS